MSNDNNPDAHTNDDHDKTEDLPVQHVRPENGTLTWLLDHGAAGKI